MTGSKVQLGGVILVGGKSRRMGRDKASLPWGEASLLEHLIGGVQQAAEPVVIVAAPGQALPAMSWSENTLAEIEVVRDRHPGCGPVEGVARGLEALTERATAAVVIACDAPLLSAELLCGLSGFLTSDYDCVLPQSEGRLHALPGVYRVELAAELGAMRAAGELRLRDLATRVRTREVDEEELRRFDRQLVSLMNCNTPAEFAQARRWADVNES